MLPRNLAPVLAVVCPVFAAAQPSAFFDCRNAESPEAGIAACTEALQDTDLLHTERARTLLRLATYNRLTGAYPAALDALTKAAAIAPNAGQIPAERAVVLHLSGDLPGARAAHAKAFALEPPGTPAMLNNRGITTLASGDGAAAIADFDAALAAQASSDATILANRAAARCHAGDVEGAVTDYLAATQGGDSRAAALEAAMAAAGIGGGLGADAISAWAAAGCPDAPDPEFL